MNTWYLVACNMDLKLVQADSPEQAVLISNSKDKEVDVYVADFISRFEVQQVAVRIQKPTRRP